MSILADLSASLKLNVDQFVSAANAAFESWDKLEGAMIMGGAKLSAAITLPLVAAASGALSMASAFQQAEIGFTTMLKSGEQAKEFLEDLKQFAAATPFQFTELQTTANRLLALGFAAKDVIPTLTAVGNAAAGLGGGADLINRITLALGQMKAKSKVSAEEMRQLAEAGIPAWQILADVIGTDVPTAMKKASAGAIDVAVAVPGLIKGMSEHFGGLMEQFAQTTAGIFSNVKDNLSFVMADIGKSLLPLANTILTTLVIPGTAALKTLAKAFADLSDPIKFTVIAVGALLAAIGPVLLALGGFASVMSSVGALLGTGGIAATLGALIPILGGLALAAAAVAAAWSLWNLKPVQSAIKSLWDVLTGFWHDTLAPIVDVIRLVADAFIAAGSAIASSAFNAIWASVTATGKELVVIVKEVQSVLGPTATKFLEVAAAMGVATIAVRALLTTTALGGVVSSLKLIGIAAAEAWLSFPAKIPGAKVLVEALVTSLSAIPGVLRSIIAFDFAAVTAGIVAMANAIKAAALVQMASMSTSIANIVFAVSNNMVGALSTGEMAIVALGQAALVAAAAFAGWKLGSWLRDNVPLLKDFGDAIGDWILKIPGVEAFINKISGVKDVVAPVKNLQTQIDALVVSLKAQGVVVEAQGSRTLPQYALYLASLKGVYGTLQTAIQDATAAHKDAEKSLLAARQAYAEHKVGIDAVVAAEKYEEASARALTKAREAYIVAIQKGNDELVKANIALTAVKKAYEDHKATQEQVAAAQERVNNLLHQLSGAHLSYKDVVEKSTKGQHDYTQELEAAKKALTEVKEAMALGAASAEDVAKAETKVKNILTAMHPEWSAVAVSVKEVTAALKELGFDKSTEEIKKLSDAFFTLKASGKLSADELEEAADGLTMKVAILQAAFSSPAFKFLGAKDAVANLALANTAMDQLTKQAVKGEISMEEYAAAYKKVDEAVKASIPTIINFIAQQRAFLDAAHEETLAMDLLDQKIAQSQIEALGVKVKRLGDALNQLAMESLSAKDALGSIGQKSDSELQGIADHAKIVYDNLVHLREMGMATGNDVAKAFKNWRDAADAVSQVRIDENTLGVPDIKSLKDKLKDATDAYDRLKASGMTVRQEMIAHAAVLAAQIEYYKTLGYNVDGLQGQLDRLNTKIKGSTSIWADWGRQVSTIVNDTGKALAAAFLKLFDNSANAALDKQATDLKSSMQKTTDAYNKTVDGIKAKLGEVTIANKKNLDQQLADLQKQMLAEGVAYARNTEDAIKAAARQRQATKDELTQRELDYKHWVQEQQLRLKELEGDTSDSANNERASINLSLQQRAEDMDQYRVTVKENLDNQSADLKTALARMADDHATATADFIDKQGAVTTAAKDNLDQQQTDLNKQLADAQDAYKQSNADTTTKLQDLQAQHKTVLDKIGDMFTSVFQSASDAVLRFVSEALVKSLFKELGKLTDEILPSLGKLMGGIFGSATTAVTGGLGTAADIGKSGTGAVGDIVKSGDTLAGVGSSAASGASSAASGIAGAMSIVGAIGSVVSAISGIIGNFQMARQEGTLNAIEQHTKVLSIAMLGISAPWEKAADGQVTLFALTGEIRNILQVQLPWLVRFMHDASSVLGDVIRYDTASMNSSLLKILQNTSGSATTTAAAQGATNLTATSSVPNDIGGDLGKLADVFTLLSQAANRVLTDQATATRVVLGDVLAAILPLRDDVHVLGSLFNSSWQSALASMFSNVTVAVQTASSSLLSALAQSTIAEQIESLLHVDFTQLEEGVASVHAAIVALPAQMPIAVVGPDGNSTVVERMVPIKVEIDGQEFSAYLISKFETMAPVS